ncbi:MAG: DUF547 domain-containing protein [Oleiphilaceae bacterium]|nr:DUF547 domain-containing protein [Oleiphilaceae bacterium]
MLLALALAFSGLTFAADFDHSHIQWHELVQEHVVWVRGGVASEVDYASFKEDRSRLKTYLDDLSDVSESQYQGWSGDEKLAFLINAYNAFTVELILTEYPDLDSIKDLGGFLSSPWSKAFFSLRGAERTLDEVEHEMIRVEFQEPRIHMAVNCASVGCPALATTAYVPDQLDGQLTTAEHRFMADKTRNRYNSAEKTFEVSPIFNWYGEDWNAESGYPEGIRGFFMSHLERLSTGAVPQRFLVIGADIEFLDYDWALNDLSNSTDSN